MQKIRGRGHRNYHRHDRNKFGPYNYNYQNNNLNASKILMATIVRLKIPTILTLFNKIF